MNPMLTPDAVAALAIRTDHHDPQRTVRAARYGRDRDVSRAPRLRRRSSRR